MKRHGFSYDVFATWSARSDRFDDTEAEELWSRCAADDAIPVGKGSFIQILASNPAGVTAAPEAMLPPPGTDEARQEQTEKFLQLFEDTDFI